eukprot:GHVQ01033103.1.p2 GENE.GHVQ01033103.1~~GHVQ01033103.1.p2  ORF type:complete len:110 (-),score=13.54 GHVQ01033103.1:235-564(-)
MQQCTTVLLDACSGLLSSRRSLSRSRASRRRRFSAATSPMFDVSPDIRPLLDPLASSPLEDPSRDSTRCLSASACFSPAHQANAPTAAAPTSAPTLATVNKVPASESDL